MKYSRYTQLVAAIAGELGRAINTGNEYFHQGVGDPETICERFDDAYHQLGHFVKELKMANRIAKEEEGEG